MRHSILHKSLAPLALLFALLISSCNDNNRSPIQGRWEVKSASMAIQAKGEYATQIDAIVTLLSKQLGLPISNLAQLNQIGTALLAQVTKETIRGFEVINIGDLDIVMKDETRVRCQFNLQNGKFTIALPAQITGLPIPLPLQFPYTQTSNELRLFIDKQTIMELTQSSAFEMLAPLLEQLFGLPVPPKTILSTLDMFDTINLSLYFDRK